MPTRPASDAPCPSRRRPRAVRRSRAAGAAALIAALSAVTLLAGARPANAWWASGHAVIAMMAYRQMKPETRAAVDALLKAHPDYAKWIAEMPAGTPEDKRGEYAFAIASTWPDRIKDSRDETLTDKFYTPGDRRNPPPVPFPSDAARFPDLQTHSNWHFLDIPIDADGKDRPIPDEDSILTALPTSRAGLAGRALPASYRAYWLCWYVHLVGDAHQPLHTTGRFTAAHPGGDQGGNLVTLQPDAAHPSLRNLHSYWDSLLGEGNPTKYNSLEGVWPELDATIKTIDAESPRLLAGYDSQTRDSLDETRWLRESYTVAQETVYTFGDVDAAEGPVPQPDAAYRAEAVKIAHQRAALAAHRLAVALDQSLAARENGR